MIKAEIKYVPGEEDPNVGMMDSSVMFMGNKNIIANELRVLLDYFMKKEPKMTINVMDSMIQEVMKKEGML